MEPIFEVKTCFDRKKYLKALKGMFLRNIRPFVCFGWIMVGMSLMILASGSFENKKDAAEAIAWSGFYVLFMYAILGFMVYNQFKKTAGFVVGQTNVTAFYQDYFTDTNSRQSVKYNYNEINKVFITGEVVAVFAGGMVIFFSVDSSDGVKISELLMYISKKGARVSTGTIKKAMKIDNKCD